MAIIQNRSQGHVITLDTANNTYTPNGFALSAFSNGSTEIVTGYAVSKIVWTGPWLIQIGGNTIFNTSNGTAGTFDLRSMGITLGGPGTIIANTTSANLTVNTNSSNATLILEVAKYSYANSGLW